MMKIDIELFRGLDRAQIKAKLALMNCAINEAFASYEEFSAAIEDSVNGLTPEELLVCARVREAETRWSATNQYRRYAEVSGDREVFYDYLIRGHRLEALREHFPERITPKLLKEFGEFWLEDWKVKGCGYPDPAYEAFRDAGCTPGMAKVRKAALEQCDLRFVKKYGIQLTDSEKARLARGLIEAIAGGEHSEVCRFLVENGFKKHYRSFLEAMSAYGYSTYRHYAEILGIELTTSFLEKGLYPRLENSSEKFELCRELHRRNPRRWEKELKSQAAKRRGRYLQNGDPIRAQQMARICGIPLTVGELLDIHLRYLRDDRLAVRAKAEQALDMAVKLVAKQVDRKKGGKTQAAV